MKRLLTIDTALGREELHSRPTRGGPHAAEVFRHPPQANPHPKSVKRSQRRCPLAGAGRKLGVCAFSSSLPGGTFGC